MCDWEEVVLTEATKGTTIVYAWNGRVLELFGWLGGSTQGAAGSQRFHAAAVEVRINGPDRKERFEVTVGYPKRGGQITYTFDAGEIERLRPLLERVRRAAPNAADGFCDD